MYNPYELLETQEIEAKLRAAGHGNLIDALMYGDVHMKSGKINKSRLCKALDVPVAKLEEMLYFMRCDVQNILHHEPELPRHMITEEQKEINRIKRAAGRAKRKIENAQAYAEKRRATAKAKRAEKAVEKAAKKAETEAAKKAAKKAKRNQVIDHSEIIDQ